MNLPLRWHTDLAVLRAGGSSVEERADHLVVRTPANPTYHWGNFVLVTDAAAADDADRWVSLFEDEFPGARHRSIGFVAHPTDASAWNARGLEVEYADVLATDVGPAAAPLADGYLARRLDTQQDWLQSVGLNVAEYPDEPEYERRKTEQNRRLSSDGGAAWFGAFHGDRLVAELGIVDCGDQVARYQSVLTAADHRRRGLAGHLLGVAAEWAAVRGAKTWVIVADEGSEASRLYQARGFTPAGKSAYAYLKPGLD